jgi:starch phosphorylase
MLNNEDRPIQFLIAGKAHPADGEGKDLIRQIIHFARESKAGHKIVFLENYDIHVARYMVQGCDVWLNTPRRGMEASGTSGMKAAINGVLNCSILDGWWDEGYQNAVGWAIGRGEAYANIEQQDEIESQALYDLLEDQIIPMFYDRDDHGVPRRWVASMKKCISTLAPAFNTGRMVRDYAEQLYVPAARRARLLAQENLSKAVALAHQKDRLRAAWSKLRVEQVEADSSRPLAVREKLPVSAVVNLDGLRPDEVCVQVYVGLLDNDGRVVGGKAYDLSCSGELGDNRYRFAGEIEPMTSGSHGFAVRIVPGGEMFEGIMEPGLILWDQQPAPPKARERRAAAVAAVTS